MSDMTVEEMKACIIAYEQEAYERYLAKNREKYRLNREARIAQVKAYNACHKEEKQTYSKAYRIANSEIMAIQRRAYREVEPFESALRDAKDRVVKMLAVSGISGMSRSDVPVDLAEAMAFETVARKEMRKVVDNT